MANSHDTYIIIDEPRVRAQENLIVNPVVILLVAMILPLFWQPPLLGSLWMPFVWLVFNGYLLGSPTLKKESLYAVIGLVLCLAIPQLYTLLLGMELTWVPGPDRAIPYLQILMRATLFLFLYLVVFTQSVPYEIYRYVREQNAT